MPSKSKAQRNLMAAAAHNPAFAKKVGIPSSVAKEFNQADKGKKFRQGGETMKDDLKQDKALIKKAIKQHDAQEHKGSKGTTLKLKKGGMCKKYEEGGSVKDVPEDDKPPVDKKGKYIKPRPFAKGGGIEVRGKTRGKMC